MGRHHRRRHRPTATTLTTLLHHLQTTQEDGQDTVTITEIIDLLSDELGEDQA